MVEHNTSQGNSFPYHTQRVSVMRLLLIEEAENLPVRAVGPVGSWKHGRGWLPWKLPWK